MIRDANGKITYGYTHPQTSRSFNTVNPNLGNKWVPDGAVIVGLIHTHPVNDLSFSPEDKAYGINNYKSIYATALNSGGSLNVISFSDSRKYGFTDREVASNLKYYTYTEKQREAILLKYSYSD